MGQAVAIDRFDGIVAVAAIASGSVGISELVEDPQGSFDMLVLRFRVRCDIKHRGSPHDVMEQVMCA